MKKLKELTDVEKLGEEVVDLGGPSIWEGMRSAEKEILAMRGIFGITE